MDLNDTLKEFEKEAQLLRQQLDAFSKKVKDFEKVMKDKVGGIKFHFKIEDNLILAWDRNDLDETKNFRLLLIHGDKSKPLIEHKMHDRIRCIRHFDNFTIAFTKYIKNYMNELIGI